MSKELPYYKLPEHLQEEMRAWIELGITPGSFLRAVLRNNLIEATTRADEISFQNLASVGLWLKMHAPEGSYGSDRVLGNWPMYLRAQANQEAFANG